MFTLAEAQAVVPWLQETFDAIASLKAEMERAQARVAELAAHVRSNGGSRTRGELERARRAGESARQRIEERVQAVVERGIIVRSVDRGLVDFPSTRDGRTVYLCWLAGESEVTEWHDIDTGFAGRRPL